MSAAPSLPPPDWPRRKAEGAFAGIRGQNVAVEAPEEVLDYLTRHSDLTDFLPEICRSVRQEFGPQAELVLRVYRDAEDGDAFLRLYVRQWPYGNDVIDRIDRVLAPFEARRSAASGWLLVSTDFRRPGRDHGGV